MTKRAAKPPQRIRTKPGRVRSAAAPRLSISVERALLERVRAIARAHDRSHAYVLRALLWKGIRALEAEGDGGTLNGRHE